MGKLSRLVLASVVGAGALPACSGRPASTAGAKVTFTNGARLSAVHYESEGAPPYFLNWYDTLLGFDCAFVATDSHPDHGVCFPSQPWPPQFADDAFRFADGACSQPVVGAYRPGESRYVVRSDPDGGSACGGPAPRLYRVGEVVPSDTTLYVREEGGTCRPMRAGEGNTYAELLLVGPEVPLDALVSGALRHDGGGRVVPVAIAWNDGSFQAALADQFSVGAWDNERQERVSVWTASPLSGNRWYPTFAANAGGFSDAGCTAAAAVGCGAVGKECLSAAFDECYLPTPTLWELGIRLNDPPTVYTPDPNNDDACVQATGWPLNDPDSEAFSCGAAIAATSFAEVSEVLTGTAQLKVIQAGTADGRAMGPVGLFDSVHQQPCGVSVEAADGTLRCLPATVDFTGLLGFFADDACSVRLISNSLASETACVPPRTFASYDESVDPNGQYRRHVYPIGERYAGMLYFQLPRDQSCGAAGSTADWSDDASFFVIGPEISPDQFARVDLVRPN
jgi:hypothetical protein